MTATTFTLTPTGGTPLTFRPQLRGTGIFLPGDGTGDYLPTPQYDEVYADGQDAEGGKLLRSRNTNTTGGGPVTVSADDSAGFWANWKLLESTLEQIRQIAIKDGVGGTLTVSIPGTDSTTFDVLSARITASPYDAKLLEAWVFQTTIEYTCLPHGRKPAYDTQLVQRDAFERDTITTGEWRQDVGPGTLSVSGGDLVPSSIAAKRIIRRGVRASDATSSARVTLGAEQGTTFSVILRGVDDSNYLEARVTGTALQLRKVVADTPAVFESAGAALSVHDPHTVLFTAAGDDLAASVTDSDGSELTSIEHTLSSDDAATFGEGTWGEVGIAWTPAGLDERAGDWSLSGEQLELSDPLSRTDVEGVPGTVDATGILTYTDVTGNDKWEVTWGRTTPGPYPHLIEAPQMLLFQNVSLGSQSGSFSPQVASSPLYGTPVQIASTGPQEHDGDQRVHARVFFSGVGPFWVRLRYQLGSGGWIPLPLRPALAGVWADIDLGIVDARGDWTGIIEAYTEGPNGDTIKLDYVQVIGADRTGTARHPLTITTPSIIAISDTFEQSSGALNGKVLNASGSQQGPLYATTQANNAGTSGVPWSFTVPGSTDPATIFTDDSSIGYEGFVTAALGNPNPDTSEYLVSGGHGFSVPSGAAITGVQVEVNVQGHFNYVSDNKIRLVQGGAVQPTDRAKTGSDGIWPGDPFVTRRVYGGPGDLWGNAPGALTPAIVNATNFGAAISAKIVNGGVGEAAVNSVRITIYYSVGAGEQWQTVGGASTDFQVDSINHVVTRTAVSDGGTGRFALAGSSQLADASVRAKMSFSALGTGFIGFVSRYVGTGDCILVGFVVTPTGVTQAVIYQVLSGATSVLGSGAVPQIPQLVPVTLTVTILSGRVFVFLSNVESPVAYGTSPALLSGGTLQRGRVGLYDLWQSSTACIRTYDDLAVWTPGDALAGGIDAAMFAGKSMMLTSDGAFRDSPEGKSGRVPEFDGSLLGLPPGDSAIFTRTRRNDTDNLPDDAVTDAYRLSLSVAPGVQLLG